MSGDKSNEKAGEERSGEIALESDGRIGGDNEAPVKDVEEGVVPEDQVEEEPHTDDPQEGTSASTARPRSTERPGRLGTRAKAGKVRRQRSYTGQSTERKKGRVGNVFTSSDQAEENEVECGQPTEAPTLPLSVSEADSAVVEGGEEVDMTEGETGVNRGAVTRPTEPAPGAVRPDAVPQEISDRQESIRRAHFMGKDNNFIKDFPQLADGLMVIPLPVEEQCRGVLSEPLPNLQLLTGDAQFSEAMGYAMMQQWRVRSNLYRVKLSAITLSTGFSKILKTLNSDSTREELLSFIQQYGSHYVSEALYGSELTCNIYFPSKRAQQQLWLQYQKGKKLRVPGGTHLRQVGHFTSQGPSNACSVDRTRK
ncbi:hypothetical protein SKAU_G00282200 [Synaphobranchus kaupii]|uniref:MACPF domain-containing protein n=1 Tax=Synaphobranchus kaupii TaxID=118154 RepID=A0A9Q1EX93_SYNKA|nr:hypothetical protein SKAU_G00282200 [Synaphobranchus kaupii]